MQCEEFEDRINAVLDQRSRPEWDDELRLHCETCAECRALTVAYGAALDGFYTLCAAQPPADLPERVLDDLRPQPATGRRVALVAAVLATAAGLAIALLPTVEQAPQLAQGDKPQTPATAPAAPLAAKTPAQPASVATTAAPAPTVPQAASVAAQADPAKAVDAADPDKLAATPRPRRPLALPKWLNLKRDKDHDPYADLVKETGRGLATLVLGVPGIGGRRGILEPQPKDAEPNWAGEMSEGLKPVTDSVTETFDLLLRTLTVSDLASKS